MTLCMKHADLSCPICNPVPWGDTGILKPLVFVNGMKADAIQHKDIPDQYWIKIKGEWIHVFFEDKKCNYQNGL